MPDSLWKDQEDKVTIKLSPDELEALDKLVVTGSFQSRSEIISWLVAEGLRTIPIDRVSLRARQITDKKRTTQKIRELREKGCPDPDAWWQITHEREIQALGWPAKRALGGGGLFGDEEVPLGIDYDNRLIIANAGKTKIPLNRDHYTKAEKELIQKAIKSLEKSIERRQGGRDFTDDLLDGLLKEAKHALER